MVSLLQAGVARQRALDALRQAYRASLSAAAAAVGEALLVSVSGDGTLRIWDTAPEWTRWRARHRLLDQGAARK